MKLRRSHSSRSVSEKPKIRISDPIPISSSVLSSITDPVLENIRDSRSNIADVTEDPENDVFSSKFNEGVESYECENPDIIPLEVSHPIEGSVSPEISYAPENADNRESEGSGVSEDSNYEVMSDVPLTTSHETVDGPGTEPLPEPIEDAPPSTAALCTLPAGPQDMTTEEKSPKSPPAPLPSYSSSYSSPCTCTAFKAEIDNIKVQMKGLAKENRELKLEINKIYSILCQKDQNSDPGSSTLRRIRKLDIGQPTNFQHTSHLGSNEVTTKIDTLEVAMKNKGGYIPGVQYSAEPAMNTRPISIRRED